MSYAFNFDTWNTNPDPSDRYGYQKDNVTVVVVADTVDEAMAKVKAVITRDVYEVERISELAGDGHVSER